MSGLGNKEVMARNIRHYMEINNKERSDMCNDLGLVYSTFTDWVNANTYPRIDKIEMMANYFGIEKSDLIEDKSKEKEQEQGFYLNIETQQIAQEIFDNSDLRMLFYASRNAKPEDLKMVHEMLLHMKKKENNEE